MAQVVSAAEAPTSRGRMGTSGITTVCISETTIPAKASTATTAAVRGRAPVRAASVGGFNNAGTSVSAAFPAFKSIA
ncbi:hypothetical protein GCM10027570_09360 [Streptomonospora sediminis]